MRPHGTCFSTGWEAKGFAFLQEQGRYRSRVWEGRDDIDHAFPENGGKGARFCMQGFVFIWWLGINMEHA